MNGSTEPHNPRISPLRVDCCNAPYFGLPSAGYRWRSPPAEAFREQPSALRSHLVCRSTPEPNRKQWSSNDTGRNTRMHHVRQENLPFVGSSHEFVGAERLFVEKHAARQAERWIEIAVRAFSCQRHGIDAKCFQETVGHRAIRPRAVDHRRRDG